MSERQSTPGEASDQPGTPGPEQGGATGAPSARPVMPVRPSPRPVAASTPAEGDRPSPSPRPADPADAAAHAPSPSPAARSVAGQAVDPEAVPEDRVSDAPAVYPPAEVGTAADGAGQPGAATPPAPSPQPPSQPGGAADRTSAGAPGAALPTRPVGSGERSAEETARLAPVAEQRTEVMPRVPAGPGGGDRDRRTELIDAGTAVLGGRAAGPTGPGGPGGPGGPDGGGSDDGDGGSGRKRPTGLIVAAAVAGVLVLGYVGDLVLSSGSVPRGTVVAGQDIGGLSRAAATEKLKTAIEPRTLRPVPVQAGEVRSEIDPKAAGLRVDYARTLDAAGEQPLNPITRLTSFFGGTREVPIANSADDRAVRTALEQMAPLAMRAPKEGSVDFDGLNPVPVAPEPGQSLDVDAAVGVVEQGWASGAPLQLPLVVQQATTTEGDVQQAVDQVARPAVSGPLTITGEGATATVPPEQIAKALSFTPDPDGPVKLKPVIANKMLEEAAEKQLKGSEKPPVDADLDFAATPARVVPSQDGRGIDYGKTFENVMPVLTGQGPRQIAAVYANKPAEITTADLQSLGNAGEISTFTTGGFSADSGQNIKRAAEGINGKIVKPGETFSLNGATNPRDKASGYVEAGIIEDGHPARGVGGGVSQLATTLYNASYFAGMTGVEHKEHSYYISRYPVAREATVFDNLIDVKFRNDGPTAVLIKTNWTPSNVTVSFFGQKVWDVESTTGPRTNPTEPQVVNLPPGQPCSPSKGAPGFTATDTRTMRNVQTGETKSETRTVKYNPQPIVQCGG